MAPDEARTAVLQRFGAGSGTGPVLVLGVGGSGKTVLLGAAAAELRRLDVPVVAVRGRRLERHLALGTFDDVVDDDAGRDERAVRTLLTARLRGGWLLVDDGQWLDAASLNVVVGLAERAATAGVGVLVATRPATGGGRGAAALLEELALAAEGLVRLAPLDEAGLAATVAALTGAPASGDVVSQLAESTGGLPLLADRLVRGWIDEGVLVSGRLGSASGRALPERVVDLLRSRLGQLDDDERAALPLLAAGAPPAAVPASAVSGLLAAGLLGPGGGHPVPLVTAALPALYGPAELAAAHRRLAELSTAGGSRSVDTATHLAVAAASGSDALDVYQRAGDEERPADPAGAAAWYRRVLAGDASRAEARVALAECLVEMGRPDEGLATAEAVLATGAAPATAGVSGGEAAPVPASARGRALAVIGCVLAARGLWSQAAEYYRTAARSGLGDWAAAQAVCCEAIAGRMPSGQLATAGPVGPAAAPAVISARAACTAAEALMATLAATTDAATTVRLAGDAAALDAGSTPPGLPAARPLEVAAWVALVAGEPAMARRLVDAGLARPGVAPRRVVLAGGWAALRAGMVGAARQALAEPAAVGRPEADDHPGGGAAHAADDPPRGGAAHAAADDPLEVLLGLALRAGLARQAGDLAEAGALARQAPALLADLPVGLLGLEAAGELAVMLHRFGQGRAADALSAAVAALLDGLGGPPLWTARRAWSEVQVGLATRRSELVEAAAAELIRVAAGRPALAPWAAAAEAWRGVASGRVDPATVDAALRALSEAGLTVEASELAGQAAIRIDDGSVAKSLLSQAREMRSGAASGDGPIETDRAVTPAGLSEREREVARLVLDGHTHKDIGGLLFISPKTVEHHVAHIRQKLGATSRAEFLAALSQDLADVDRVG